MIEDYRQFKTPFFRIRVGSGKARNPNSKEGKNDWYLLPESMLRLIESIEVYEALFTPEYDDFAKIVIKFIAGSREPLQIGPAGVGPSFLSNNSSALLDVPFLNGDGSTQVDKNRFPDIIATIESNDGGLVRKETVNVPTAPRYLLQERNAVEVTFGYKEDGGKELKRIATGYIAIIQSEFPESGSPRTTVTCQMRPFVDQMNPIEPPVFGVTLNDNNVVNIQSDTIRNTIINLWKGVTSDNTPAGLFDRQHLIISDTLNINELESDLQITWPATESMDQFLKKLATLNYAYYDIIVHPVDKKPVLIFIKKADFESKLIALQPNLFNYKAPGSIIKSLNFRADFAISGVNTQLVVNQDGELSNITSFTGKEQQSLANSSDPIKKSTNRNKEVYNRNQPVQFEEFISLDPAGEVNPIPFCQSTATFLKNYTQRSEYHPGRNASVVADTLASVRSAVTSNAIQLEMLTIGHPFLTPGLVHLKGIGTRYSGKYRILTVSHVIDSNGYICRCQATNHALSKGGISVLDTGEKSSNVFPDPKNVPIKTPGLAKRDILQDYQDLIKLS